MHTNIMLYLFIAILTYFVLIKIVQFFRYKQLDQDKYNRNKFYSVEHKLMILIYVWKPNTKNSKSEDLKGSENQSLLYK